MKGRKAYISEKLFDRDYNGYFLATLFTEDIDGPSQQVLLKPKTNGNTMIEDKFPIVYILIPKDKLDLNVAINPFFLKSVDLGYLHKIIKQYHFYIQVALI